jgi:hypothetical protein
MGFPNPAITIPHGKPHLSVIPLRDPNLPVIVDIKLGIDNKPAVNVCRKQKCK